METIKKFKKYLINFIVLYIIVTALVWLCTKTFNKESDITEVNTYNNTIQTEH